MTHDLARYFAAQTERKRAYAAYNYAGADLKCAQIKERLAEIRSQHQPLADLCGENSLTREKMIAVAHYVVHGRFPK